LSEFPERLELDSAGARTTYVLRRDVYAVHDWDGSHADQAVHAIPGGRVAAFRGDPAGRMPVYESTAGGRLVYPTGTVWVRFSKGTDARGRAADLKHAGFRIAQSPGYAPHGAFVTAVDAAWALSHLEALRAIDGVEVVEPQMLVEASAR
jgi:hypothetical protein